MVLDVTNLLICWDIRGIEGEKFKASFVNIYLSSELDLNVRMWDE